MRTILNILIIIFCLKNTLIAQETLTETNWPQWRGPLYNGLALAGNPPVEWNEDMNVKWKVKTPGKGHSTPIIWGDQMILTSAVQTDVKVEPEVPIGDQEDNQWMSPTTTDFIHEFVVLSINRNNGEILWQTTVREELPHSGTHEFGSWASNSPSTDGEHIYAYFGSIGLYCLDMKGKLVWDREFGQMEKVMNFGEGSSPLLYKDKLIVLRDHQGQSAIHVINKNTGEDIWKADRDEVSSWATPYIVEHEGRPQLITSATTKIRSYDLTEGNVIWECSGMTRNVIPTPVSADGLIYLMSGFRGSALLAVNLSKAKGNIDGSDAIVWKYDQNTPYTPSSVLMDGMLYFLKANNGYLSCLDAKTGQVYYTNQKLEGIQNIFASPVGVSDRIYITGANGTFHVVKNSTDFEVLSQNNLEDSFHASPVIIGDNMYLRGFNYLYCISEK
jgi:outer membrane protein assembly factor BamB